MLEGRELQYITNQRLKVQLLYNDHVTMHAVNKKPKATAYTHREGNVNSNLCTRTQTTLTMINTSFCIWTKLSGPLYRAIAVPSVMRCRHHRCWCGHRCAGSDTWWMAMRHAAARSGEWAQHFSNASCYFIYTLVTHLHMYSNNRCSMLKQ